MNISYTGTWLPIEQYPTETFVDLWVKSIHREDYGRRLTNMAQRSRDGLWYGDSVVEVDAGEYVSHFMIRPPGPTQWIEPLPKESAISNIALQLENHLHDMTFEEMRTYVRDAAQLAMQSQRHVVVATQAPTLPRPRSRTIPHVIDDGHSIEHTTREVHYYTANDITMVIECCAQVVEEAKKKYPPEGYYSSVGGILQLRADEIRNLRHDLPR